MSPANRRPVPDRAIITAVAAASYTVVVRPTARAVVAAIVACEVVNKIIRVAVHAPLATILEVAT